MISDLENISLTPTSPTSLTGPLFAIPDQDTPEYQSLPDPVRRDLDLSLAACETIHSSTKVARACRKLSQSFLGKRGFSYDRLRAKYYDYLKDHDWRVLVDYSRVPKSHSPTLPLSHSPALPFDFIEFLKSLMQLNQRKSEPAIRLLYKMWRQGDSIPAYGTWQEWFQAENPHHPLPQVCPPELPKGWSKGNLRRHIPEDAELALSRQGVAAARSHLPPILGTREGLRPLELIQFDDVKTDFKIMVPGYSSPVDLNLLVCIDVATGMILRYGLRPAVLRDDGIKDKLKLRDMKILIAGLLLQYGVPTQYTMTLVVENQTATVREGTALALAELSNNQIEVSKTMMIQGTALFGGYRDRSLGNPGGKGLIESTFNLLHNEAGFVPGQTGRRYDSAPQELTGRTREAESLSRTAKHLTPHDRARLKYPFLNVDQARLVLTDLFNQIIHRTDHRMEGFALVGEFRTHPNAQWRPESDLLTDPQLSSNPEIQQSIEWRTPARKESPFERWTRLCSSLTSPTRPTSLTPFQKLHPGAIARLYDESKLLTIKEGQITFDFEKQPYTYRTANIQHAPSPAPLPEKVLAYFDPQDLSYIHLTNCKGGYLGSIPRTRGLKHTDKAGFKTEMTRRFDELRQLQATVSARMPQIAEDHLADTNHNITVLTEALATTEAIEISPSLTGPTSPTTPTLPPFVAAIQSHKHAAQVAERQILAEKQRIAQAPDLLDEILAGHQTRHANPESEKVGECESGPFLP